MTINERVDKLRLLMQKNNIDTYIITKFDPHQSEYAPARYDSVKFISGFTGSNATAVITEDKAMLWTDGRYFIQAAKQIQGTYFDLQKENHPNFPDYQTFVRNSTKKGGCATFDGKCMSTLAAKNLAEKLSAKNINCKIDIDLLDEIWEDRPELSNNKIFDLLINYAGKSRSEKLEEIRKIMSGENIDVYVISSLDDIAWLFNLRGNDVPYNTTFASYAIVEQDSAVLFVDSEKISDCVEILRQDNVTVKKYNEIFDYIKNIDKNKFFGFDENRTNYALYTEITSNFRSKNIKEITVDLKACKNKIEIENLKSVNIRDSVYLLRFIKWIKENVGKEKITELDVEKKLIELRSKDKNFLFPSFNTIAAYMPNAAMMHYSATEESHAVIEPKGFLLVDSGGQYLDGTTDVTRTIVLGKIDEQMKRDFTLTLKSNISLARAIFLDGTCGVTLDMLARQPMWNNLMDYKCGTGHGIGFCLGVHEGPQNISLRPVAAPLKEGMIISNEPGVYRENMYGIRTETTILVKFHAESEFGRFLSFETISPCPIDLEAIDVSLLTQDEIKWINAFHEDVFNKLSPFLNEDERYFLRLQTLDI